MIGNSEAQRAFRRLVAYTAVAAVLTTAVALTYLGLTGSLTVATVIATTVAVLLSVSLGGGLMAMGFLSSNSGHDDTVSHLHLSGKDHD